MEVMIHETDTVFQTHTDWTFQWQFNKTFGGQQIYAQINFTDFMQATDLTITPE